jgi:hypothetical protein
VWKGKVQPGALRVRQGRFVMPMAKLTSAMTTKTTKKGWAAATAPASPANRNQRDDRECNGEMQH